MLGQDLALISFSLYTLYRTMFVFLFSVGRYYMFQYFPDGYVATKG